MVKEPYFTSALFHMPRCPIIPLSAPTKYQYLQLILAGIRLYRNPVFHILTNRFVIFILLILLLSKSFQVLPPDKPWFFCKDQGFVTCHDPSSLPPL